MSETSSDLPNRKERSPHLSARADRASGGTPHLSTRFSRWGFFVLAVAMGVGLVGSALVTWHQNREAATTVAEARTLDLFRAVRRALRDVFWDKDVDLAGLRQDFADAGLRYVGVFDREGQARFEEGQAVSDVRRPSREAREAREQRDPEPRPERVGERLRLEGPLAPRAGWRGRGLRLVIEVDPTLGRSLEDAAKRQLGVSIAVALVLVAMSLVFWRLRLNADRLERMRARDQRLAALGSMSAVLGHELRNPLAALKGHAQLALERTAEGEKSRKNLERVVSESERLERLMGQILEFARTGQVQLEEASPAELVRTVVDKVGAPVAVDLSAAPERWRFDRARMEQVLSNLVRNALEAAPGGQVAVTVRGGEALELRVADSGAGFQPDEHGRLEWVFEPFATSGKMQGTGLGLAIARHIAEAHGGRISAENAPGGGAVVTIVLPRGGTGKIS